MGKYPGYEFQDELNNPMQYEKGIVAMANRGLIQMEVNFS